MALTTLDGLIAAPRQGLTIRKTASVTAVAAQITAVHQAAGNPGAGVLAVGNTANGLVPTDATAELERRADEARRLDGIEFVD